MMSATRDLSACAASLALLAGAVLVWPSLFLFAKVVTLPAWAANLPPPFTAGGWLALGCLLPAGFATSRPLAAAATTTLAAGFAPLLALLALAAARSQLGVGDVLANWVFVVFFHVAGPALLVVAVRAMAAGLAARRR